MAKVVSQDTYDEVIKENIVEFSMSVDEAREETIKQFEAQGVNLANIIKDLSINEKTGVPIMNEAIANLKNHIEKTKILDNDELEKQVEVLTKEICKSVPHRVLAGKSNAHDYLLHLIEVEIARKEIDFHHENSFLHRLILCSHAMTHKNPDLFDAKSLSVVLQLLDTQKNAHIISDTLKWIQKACLLHENNRQMFLSGDMCIILHLNDLLTNRHETDVIKNICTTLRFLILDDDIRVEFGKAHDHARIIAQECLVDLTKLMTKFKSNPDLLAELMLTIAALTVRNEYCQTIADAGGITLIMDAMVEFQDSIKVTRESFKLIKALAGNDAVKVEIIKRGAASIIESSLNRHKADETVAKSGLVAVSTLALRLQDNAAALFETGIAETIIETMKIHEKNQVIQRNGAWAIRNMVSRSREQCESWLALGAEEVLQNAQRNHPSMEQDVKSALRDLGAKVHLKEEWKGTAEKVISSD